MFAKYNLRIVIVNMQKHNLGSIIDHSQSGDDFAPIVMKSNTTLPFMYQFYVSTFTKEDRDTDGTTERYATSLGAQFYTYTGTADRAYSTAPVDLLVQDDTSAVDPAPEYWYHIALVWGAGRARFYIDGSLVQDEPLNGNPNAAVVDSKPLVIGADYPGLDEFFYGVLDDLRIYNRALSGDDVAALYAAD